MTACYCARLQLRGLINMSLFIAFFADSFFAGEELIHYVSLVLINLLHLRPLHHLHCHHPSHLHFFILS